MVFSKRLAIKYGYLIFIGGRTLKNYIYNIGGELMFKTNYEKKYHEI